MKNFLKKIIIGIITLEAKIVLKKYKPKIVAVTGSVGKTSTKDAIYTVLEKAPAELGLKVRKNQKSFNSEIGVPITILGVENGWSDPLAWLGNILHGLELILFKTDYPNLLVLEVGADHPGDIKSIASWLQPDVAIVTRVGDVPVHVEFFSTPNDLLLEKAELVKGMKKDGTAILFADEERVLNLPQTLNLSKTHPQAKVLTFGSSNSATMSVSNLDVLYEDGKPVGMNFKVNWNGNSMPAKIHGGLGIQHVYPALTAILVGQVFGVNPLESIDAMKGHKPPIGRMNVIEGRGGSILIDDSYNSSPDAVNEALNIVSSLQSSLIKRKIVVLGDMMELGKYSTGAHIDVGRETARLIGDSGILITVGQRAKGIAEGAIGAGMDKRRVMSYENSREVGGVVLSMVGEGDVVLVKGSQSARMERVSEIILGEGVKAEDVLVRQDKEWKAR